MGFIIPKLQARDRRILKGRPEDEDNDCAVRALALASGRSYRKVHKLLKEHGREEGHPLDSDLVRKAARALGLRRVRLKPRRRVENFLDDWSNRRATVAALVRGHMFAVREHTIRDLRGVRFGRLVIEYWEPRK